MKVIVVHEFGGPEVLKFEDVPTPSPTASQVLVRVYAAGVNPYDTYMRSGNYTIKPSLPYTPGSDAAGTVESVGEGVKSVRPGDRVYTAKTITGAYAEYALALESQLHPLPKEISYAQGASIWVPYGTAYHALHQCLNARAGETLLIHGASGGVGIAATQIGRALGMVVLGTAGTEEGIALVKREGAHQVFNHAKTGYLDEIQKATSGHGVDIILEMLANVNLGPDLKLLARHGRVVIIGSRGEATIMPRELMARGASVHGMVLWNIADSEEREIHAGILAALENGTMRPIVGKELPLAEAARAHKEILQSGAVGKMILVP